MSKTHCEIGDNGEILEFDAEDFMKVCTDMNGVKKGVRIWDTPLWIGEVERWRQLIKHRVCYYCKKPLAGDCIPHHISKKPGDTDYLPLFPNNDIVPVHHACHSVIHYNRALLWLNICDNMGARLFLDDDIWWRTRLATGIKKDEYRCICCKVHVSKKVFAAHRSRCVGCDKEDKKKAKLAGLCWNCGWPYTGEYASYKAAGGLCRLCFAVRDDPVLFGRQLWERNGIGGA